MYIKSLLLTSRRALLVPQMPNLRDRVEMPGVAAGLAVLAGIAAADAVCAARLGRIHRGDDHRGAADLLRQAVPDGKTLRPSAGDGGVRDVPIRDVSSEQGEQSVDDHLGGGVHVVAVRPVTDERLEVPAKHHIVDLVA